MPEADDIRVNDLLKEQYWSLQDIIDVSCSKKFELEPERNGSVEETIFKTELVAQIQYVSHTGRIFRLKQQSEGPAAQFAKSIGRGIFPLLAISIVYGVLGYLPVASVKEHIPKLELAVEIGVVLPVVGLVTILLLFYGELFYRKLTATTPIKRYKYVLFNADRKALREELFESDSVITFLQHHFKLNIPRDPYRVWPEPFFRRNGDVWTMGYSGERFSLRVDKGSQETYERIAYLLAEPYKDFSCIDLASTKVSANEEFEVEAAEYIDNDESPDYRVAETLSDYELTKSALRDLEEMHRIAKEDGLNRNDEEHKEEIDKVKKYMRQTFTRAGKLKSPRGDHDRAKEVLKQTRKRFIDRVKKYSPDLAEHLRRSIKLDGGTVSYRPPEEISWDIQQN
jgi:hypothetical protein